MIGGILRVLRNKFLFVQHANLVGCTERRSRGGVAQRIGSARNIRNVAADRKDLLRSRLTHSDLDRCGRSVPRLVGRADRQRIHTGNRSIITAVVGDLHNNFLGSGHIVRNRHLGQLPKHILADLMRHSRQLAVRDAHKRRRNDVFALGAFFGDRAFLNRRAFFDLRAFFGCGTFFLGNNALDRRCRRGSIRF